MTTSKATESLHSALGDVETTALLVIDMQNDFANEEGYFGSRREAMQERLNCDPRQVSLSIPSVVRLLSACRHAGLRIFHTRMIREPDRENSVRNLHRVVPKTYEVVVEFDESIPPPLVPGSWGADLIQELAPRYGERVIAKRGMSAFYGTDLEILLRRYGVRTLILAGTLAHACVLHSAFDARARDFDVIVAREATSTWAQQIEAAVFELIDLIVGRVVSVDDICQTLTAITRSSID